MTRVPRCAAPMRRYETSGIPALPGVPAICGRPAGHRGWHRSVEAIRRYGARQRQYRIARRNARKALAA